jgi:nucleotide-binding universal stress UspA family protein
MSDPIRTIVAGVSHPADDDPTLIAAAELARWTGARLHLVHAFDLAPLLGPPNAGHASAEAIQRHADDQRVLLESAARRTPGAEGAVCHTVPGTPGTAILDTATEAGANLIVVGASRAGWVARTFLGYTAQHVLRGAGVPVLVVRTPVHRPLERLLLTTDLSELSAAVHEAALDTVESLFGGAAAARSLLVVTFPILPSPLPRETLDRVARGEFDAFLRARRTRSGAVEPVVRAGEPEEEIVAEAEGWNADLLVVGTHARGWAARLTLGSVAEASLRDAPCNVLALPPRAVSLEPPVAEAPSAGASPADEEAMEAGAAVILLA